MTEKDYLPQFAAELIRDLNTWATVTKQAVLFTEKPREAAYSAQQIEGLIDTIRKAIHIVLPMNGEIYRDQFDIPTKEELKSTTAIPAPIVTIEHPLNDVYWGKNTWIKQKPIAILTLVIDHKQYNHENGNVETKGSEETIRVEGSDEEYTQGTVMNFWKMGSAEDVGLNKSQKVSWMIAGNYLSTPVPFYMMKDPTDPEKMISSGLIFDIFTQNKVEDLEEGAAVMRNYYGSLNAVIQTCHSLRVGATLEARKEKSYTRSRTFEKAGVGGFEYHVLKLPHGTVRETLGSRQGDRDGPRYHFRRAHLRNLSSGAQTFVRSCFVGNREKGEIVKNYEMTKETAA